MIRINILLMFFCLMCSVHAAEPLKSEDVVGTVFESISTGGTNIVLKFKSSGRRFNYAVNDGELKINNYGEEIVLPIGATMQLFGRGVRLSFSVLPSAIKDCGFHVRKTEDHRSGGGRRDEKEGYLVILKRQKESKHISSADRAGEVIITKASIEAVNALMMTNKMNDGDVPTPVKTDSP